MEANDDIGIICIEGARYDFPNNKFVDYIMSLCSLVLVLDEITSGWRLTDGGVYKLNDLEPDIVVYGKALGGGYAISAVVGKKEVMDVAQETYKFNNDDRKNWFVAAIKTIEVLSREKSLNYLNSIEIILVIIGLNCKNIT